MPTISKTSVANGCRFVTLALSDRLPAASADTDQRAISTGTDTHGLNDLDSIQETLNSLEQVDDYPLYTMRFVGPYQRATDAVADEAALGAKLPAWGCALFATFADAENGLYGRNFDWQYSPALLLFTDPPDGYRLSLDGGHRLPGF